jgi:hypothetical protein
MRLAQGRKAKPNANTRKPSPDKCLVVPSLSPGLRPHCPRNTGANAVTTREGLRRSVTFLEDGTDGFPPLRSRVVIIPRLAPRLHLQQHGQFRHRQKVSTLPPLKQYLTRATHVTKVESKYYVLCSLAHSLRFDNIMAKAKFSANPLQIAALIVHSPYRQN